jgi:hypothetical protein
MFDTLYDLFTRSILVLVIFLALAMRLCMKHPNASGGVARGILGLLFRNK